MIEIKSLEIHASYHCNLSCKNCMHLSPYEDKHFIDFNQLKDDLMQLKNVLKADVLRILGGEPLLNPNLSEIVLIVKESEISNTISIATNGTRIKSWVNNPIWNEIDECEISLYPCVKSKHKEIIDSCESISKKFNVKFLLYYCNSFRKAYSLQASSNKQMTQKIFDTCLCVRDWQCFNLFEGKFYLCPQAFAFARNGITDNNESDYVDLINCKNLEQELSSYINRTKPLEACSYCYGNCGLLEAHTQELELKFNTCTHPYEENIDFDYLKELLENPSSRSSMGTINTIDTISFS